MNFSSVGNVVLAPMVNQSELAFRMLCRRYNINLCFTPMIHSRLFVEDATYAKHVFSTVPEDRPLVVQICGHDPHIMLAAATRLQEHCDAIDINFGCPQNIARRGNYGAFLLEEEAKVLNIVRHLSKNLKVPLSCKIRIYPDRDRTLKLVKNLEEAGCKLLTVHGRTKEDKKEVKHADWDIIKDIKSMLSIPVYANGSVANLDQLQLCLKETLCDAVMTSEAILENPAMFDETLDQMPSQFDLAREYLSLAEKYPGSSSKMKRTHLFRFLHGPISYNPEFRQVLGRARENDFVACVDQFEKAHKEKSGSIAAIFTKRNFEGYWYMRYRTESKEKKRKLEVKSTQPSKSLKT